ncbi:MAG: helix-turn-helix domain-containing protein [Acidimicrobiia bacterium]
MTAGSTRDEQLHALGAFIRAQRQLANLSLRQLADLTHVSNPYLSQLERGLHEPSVRVLQSISRALDLSTESLLRQVGMADDEPPEHSLPETEAAIRQDAALTDEQKQALLSVYRSYLQANGTATPAGAPSTPEDRGGV